MFKFESVLAIGPVIELIGCVIIAFVALFLIEEIIESTRTVSTLTLRPDAGGSLVRFPDRGAAKGASAPYATLESRTA